MNDNTLGDAHMEYFKRAPEDYVTDISPVKNSVTQLKSFIAKYCGVSDSVAASLLKEFMKTHKKPRDPMVTFRKRDSKGDREMDKISLSKYLSNVIREGDVLAPTLTVYDAPEKIKSIHAGFLAGNVEKRSKHKKAAFACYQNEDWDGHKYNDVIQKVMKIFNNSLSGTYASKSTAIYNPSAHYTLTSITRCVASIGNAITESIVAGNRCLYTPDAAMNYLVAVVSTVDMNKVEVTVNHYNLYYPTPEDVIAMVRHSTDRYWSDEHAIAKIRVYLSRLNKYELAAILYINDLHHLKKHNQEFVKNFIGDLGRRVPNGCAEPLKALRRNVDGINNLVHHICMDDIRGMRVNYEELSLEHPEVIRVLGSTADNIYRVLDKHRLLIKTFFTSDILPIDTANVKDLLRDSIGLSDTDSTCGSYDKWVEWYYGNTKFTSEAVGLSAAVMTINTQAMDHNIKVFAKNMNITHEAMCLLNMKNEFFWSVFVAANVSKHYYANTVIQEGNVFAKPKLELKGVHLIASTVNQEIVNSAKEDMVKAMESMAEGKEIDQTALITKVANIERSILSGLEAGDIKMFKTDKIKEVSAYKSSEVAKTPYFHHMLWEEVFADKYGTPGDPPYMCVRIPSTAKTKRTLHEFLGTIEDVEIRNKLADFLNKHGKDALGTFRVPLAIAGGTVGVPKEFLAGIDKHRIVLDNTNVYRIFLETLGIFPKKKLLISEMGY